MKFCSNCGNELKEGSKFCDKCGNNIEIVETTNKEAEEKVVMEPFKPVTDQVQQPVNNTVKTNGFAVAGFVISLVNFCCCGIFSGLGLIFSIIGLVQINKSGANGKGLAITGIVLSAIGIVFLIIMQAFGYAADAISTIEGTTSAFMMY